MSYTRMTTLLVFVSILSRIIEQINNKYCLSIYFLCLKKGGNSSETNVSDRNLHGTKKAFQVMIHVC